MSLCLDCDKKYLDFQHGSGTQQSRPETQQCFVVILFDFQLKLFTRLWLRKAESTPRRACPGSLVTLLAQCCEKCSEKAHLDWNGSDRAKSARPWVGAPLWLCCSLPMNVGGRLICVIASKSTLDSSLGDWKYNADTELFLCVCVPREVIR